LHHKHRHAGIAEFGQPARWLVTRGPARGLQRKRKREHARGADLTSGAARHASAAAAPSENDGRRRTSLTQQCFAGSCGHGNEGRVERSGGGGRAPPRDPVGLLDQSDSHAGVDSDGGNAEQVRRSDPAARSMSEQQQTGRAARSGRTGWVPGEACGPGGRRDVGPRHSCFVQDRLISPKSRTDHVGESQVTLLPLFRPQRLRFAYPGR
jgi:hypothetical protein